MGTPYISANAKNICLAVNGGEKGCPANIVKLEGVVYIQDYGLCRVNVRIHRRNKNIGFFSDTYGQTLQVQGPGSCVCTPAKWAPGASCAGPRSENPETR